LKNDILSNTCPPITGRSHLTDTFADETLGINCVLGICLLLSACSERPLKPTIIMGLLGTRVAVIVTGEQWMHFFSLGFTATIFQKISHLVTDEASTLESEELKGGNEVVGGEWAHVTYFPTLLLERVYQTLSDGKSTA